MKSRINDVFVTALQSSTVLLFMGVVGILSLFQPAFRDSQNLLDILEQSVPVAIVGLGITFVLLTAGIDLSVGATMYVAVVVSSLFLQGQSPAFVFVSCISIGLIIGLMHGLIIRYFQVAPFIVTLATMFILRGFGKRLMETRALIADEAVTRLERQSVVGIPLSVWVLMLLVVLAWIVLKQTTIGRQVYAVGESREAAQKAGVPVGRVLLTVYAACGACAGLAGFIALSQQGAAQNTFGTGVEFAAVAAAVLGGTSLYGGRGNAWGATFGAVFVSVISASLNFANADPYIYPLVTAFLIFAAAAFDSFRNTIIERQLRRRIRAE